MKTYEKIFLGTAFTSETPKEVKILKDHLFCINAEGIIETILSPKNPEYQSILTQFAGQEHFHRLADGQYLLPGFIDLHVHAPQWAQTGTALDIPLYDWLNEYTFPLEAKFADPAFAQTIYSNLVDTLLANGTTTAMYFATIHKETSLLLAKLCVEKGQRGLVGKVVMDDPQANPDYCRDASPQVAIEDTEAFIVAVQALNKSTKQGVYPVVTPRFIPSCSDEALKGLGQLAAKYNTHIQSHCSESDWAHGFVKERFGKNDAFALHDFGLLTQKSVMAHCNFLDEADAALYAKTGTAIAHSPISNAYFANSVLPVSHLQNMGVEIGLDTDLSGGFSPSLYDNIRQAVMSSRMLEDGVNPRLSAEERGLPASRITVNEAFYLATAGGGQSLSLPVGRLAPGYAWDAQVVDTKIQTARLPIFNENEDLKDIFQKILYLTRPENIREVWVQGSKVHERI